MHIKCKEPVFVKDSQRKQGTCLLVYFILVKQFLQINTNDISIERNYTLPVWVRASCREENF